MPIKFDLEELRKTYDCENYFETGLFDPRLEVSIKKALASQFKRVDSIELRHDFVNMANLHFAEDIKSGRCHIYLDDSVNLSKYLTDPVFMERRTMFFLDAHVDNIRIQHFRKRCPLFDELEAIATIPRKDCIILVDDLRILKEPQPWGDTSYTETDYITGIKNKILNINPNYKFMTLNGHVPNDVLLAYC